MTIAVVTGAAGDIGQAIVTALIGMGYAVAGLDVDDARLTEFAASCDETFLPISCDIRSMTSVTAAITQAEAALGPVTLLINNAGAITTPSLLATDEAHWLADIDLNLNGAWRCIRAVQHGMVNRRAGIIVNIASVNGISVYGHPGYSVAKAGLIHLTRFCATEFAKYGLRSFAICPGSVKTQAWHARAQLTPDILTEAASWYPTRDVSEPAAIAKLVTLGLDPELSQLNGAIIALDGGLTSGSDRLASVFAGETI